MTEHKILHPTLPITDPPIPYPHHHNPHILILNIRTPPPIPAPRLSRTRTEQTRTATFLPIRLESIVREMLLLGPLLLLAAGLEYHCLPVHRARDARHGGRVHLHEHVGEAAGAAADGAAFALGAGGDVGRAGADPVVGEEGDVGVLEEIEGFLGGGVGGHDDEGTGGEAGAGVGMWIGGVVEGVGGEVGVVHEGDMGPVVGAGGEVELRRMVSMEAGGSRARYREDIQIERSADMLRLRLEACRR